MTRRSEDTSSGALLNAGDPGGAVGRSLQAGTVLLLALLLTYLVASALGLVIRGTLGHDESVYALRAHDLESGWTHLSGGYWNDYRAPGLPLLIAAVQLVVPAAPTVARLVVVALGAVVLGATWQLARTMHGVVAATVAVGSLLVTTGFLVSSSMVLADIPGMAFGLSAVVILHAELRRKHLRWSLVAVPLLGLAATLCRFGAPFALAGGLGAVGLVALPDLVRARRIAQIARLAVTGVATALVCGTVLLTTTFTLGGKSPVESNSELIGSKGLTPATGFSDLRVVLDPWGPGTNLWGKPTAVFVVLGLLGAVVAALRSPRARRPLLVAALAGAVSLVGVVASVGLVVPNYLMLSLPYWAIAVGIGWSFALSWVARRSRRTWVAPAALAVAFALVLPGVVADARAGHRNNSAAYGHLAAVSEEVAERLGPGCLIITSYTPQVGYYSGCSAYPIIYRTGEDLDASLRRVLDRARRAGWEGNADQAVLFTVNLGKRQPPPEVLAAGGEAIAERIIDDGHLGAARQKVSVDLLEPCFVDPGACG